MASRYANSWDPGVPQMWETELWGMCPSLTSQMPWLQGRRIRAEVAPHELEGLWKSHWPASSWLDLAGPFKLSSLLCQMDGCMLRSVWQGSQPPSLAPNSQWDSAQPCAACASHFWVTAAISGPKLPVYASKRDHSSNLDWKWNAPLGMKTQEGHYTVLLYPEKG